MTRVLHVEVASRASYLAADAPHGLTDALRDRLSVANPKYVAAKRMDRHPGKEPARLCGVTEFGNAVSMPRGGLPELREVAAAHGLRLRCVDQRAWPAERLRIEREVSLRDYQRRAVGALERCQQGAVHLPAGGGKTRTALGAIARLDTPALVIVGAIDLAQQWCASTRDMLGIEPGVIGGGAHSVRPVTVATVQSLARMADDELDTLLGSVGFVIVDECHHAAAPTYRRILDRCPARYRLGLTATPDREDGLGPMVGWYLGACIASVTHDELIAAGHLAAAGIRELRTDYHYRYSGPDDWPHLLDDLVADPTRNGLIVDAIERDVHGGHVVLALSGRVAHAEYLAAELVARGVEAVALVGRVPKRRRAAILDAARAGEVQVVVATQLADEGLDIPRLSRVYQTYPARAAGRTEQRLGRVMRPHPDARDIAIVDVVDHRVGVLAHQASRRMAVYRRVLGSAPRGEVA